MSKQYASVVLDISINKALDYAIPDLLAGKVFCGTIVKVPLKGKSRYGIVVDIKDRTEHPHIKSLISLVAESNAITKELFELYLWISEHYCTSLEEIIKIAIPSSIRGKSRPKQQYYISRGKSIEELRSHCIALREKKPKQAEILEAMLSVNKGILLTELIEKASANRSSVQSLIKNGLLLLREVRIDRSPLENEEYFPAKPKILTEEQAAAVGRVTKSLAEESFETHLIWGVTGSGKTEVYLQAIGEALKKGKSSIMLVPEISLTAQTIERFKSRFTDRIAILHSRLSNGERYDEWINIANGNAQIVIGARSSIFSPVKNLGLIIVDEEHDASYKQSESMPCYNARDVAVMRGKLSSATVILGSATPSLETFYNCGKGKYALSILKKRALNAELPTVKIVDMKREFAKAKGFTIFSEELLAGIGKRLQEGEQTILFLNRRGYHTMLLCPACGSSLKCKHCDISLTFHKGENQLSCHLCGYEESPPPKSCPSCKSQNPLKFKGIGTEQVERALHSIFPKIRTLRLDRDTTKHKGSHQRFLRDFKTGKADVLIGTQMIAKGLHFPEVTLVGILNCDNSLNIPDFRASENTFQLITQVAGRSGRGAINGEVILQTAIPDNSTILHASCQDYENFFAEELETRKLFGFPPFAHLAKIRCQGKDPQKTLERLTLFREKLIARLPQNYAIAPALSSAHAKIKDSYRFQFFVRGPNISKLTRVLKELMAKEEERRLSKLFIDINPLSTFF